MNHIADNIICETVEKVYNDSISKYGEKQIIGAYVYGNAHYGFAKNLKDIKIIILYIPTLEELCFNSMISKKIDDNKFIRRNATFKELSEKYNFSIEEFKEYRADFLLRELEVNND